jgi:hypothetical protein
MSLDLPQLCGGAVQVGIETQTKRFRGPLFWQMGRRLHVEGGTAAGGALS